MINFVSIYIKYYDHRSYQKGEKGNALLSFPELPLETEMEWELPFEGLLAGNVGTLMVD